MAEHYDDTEHDALANTLLDCCAVTRVGADLWHPHDEVINAILTEFLPDHDKRLRAEQRDTDIAAVQSLRDEEAAGYGPFGKGVWYGIHTDIGAIREASDD